MFLVGCDGNRSDEDLAAQQRRAALACERLAACHRARGDTKPPIETMCDYATTHEIDRCQNACITKLWTEHDDLLATNEPLPTACRCGADADCAPDIRHCDTTSGACIDND